MSKIKKFKTTRKRADALIRVKKKADMMFNKNQCDCPHNNQHGPALRLNKEKRQNGALVYTCTLCRKDLYLNAISAEDLNISVRTLESVIDTIKLKLNLDKPKDLSMMKDLAGVEFRIKYVIPGLYDACRKDNNQRNKNKQDDPDMRCYANSGSVTQRHKY